MILTGTPVSQWKAHINSASGRDHHINPAPQGTTSTKKRKKNLTYLKPA